MSRIHASIVAGLTIVGLFALATGGSAVAGGGDAERPQPTAVDDRLVVELFAEHPEVVTPTGIDVDDQGRVVVFENNTHQRRDDYEGPEFDRVLRFEDTTGDGRADARTVVHDEGLADGNGLKIGPDGSIYVSTRSHVYRLVDTDGDGTADRRETIVELVTDVDYPHNGLAGLAFDFRGRLYVSMGENFGGAYELVGSDGQKVSGVGEGGNVFRCEADGSNVERIAEGFWNPWGITVDVFGRLIATDNDPHSSPPCRLLHVVPGGHYGFEYRYGSGGLHPLHSWEGHAPGTLPMAAPMSQAPCGIVAYESDLLPEEYRGRLLAGIWSDRRVEMFDLEPRGATVQSSGRTLINSADNFRAVDVAVAPDGSVYVSDWVLSSYPVHGHGRIWRVRPKEEVQVHRPTDPHEAVRSPDRRTRERAARALAEAGDSERGHLRELAAEADNARVRAAAIQALAMVGDAETDFAALAEVEPRAEVQALAVEAATEQGVNPAALIDADLAPSARAAAVRAMRWPEHRQSLLNAAAADDDPYMQTAAWYALSRTPEQLAEVDPGELDEPAHRLAMAIALQRSRWSAADAMVPRFLEDPDPSVRYTAVKWVADRMLEEHRPQVERMLETGDLTPRLYRAILATLDHLEGEEPQPTPSPERLAETIFDDDAALELRRMALRVIDPAYEGLTLDRLRPLLDAGDERLRLTALRTLQLHPSTARFPPLAEAAADEQRSVAERTAAVLGLAPDAENHVELLVDLATRGEPSLRAEALRALIGVNLGEAQREQLAALAEGEADHHEAVQRVLGEPPAKPAPTDRAAWMELASGDGDAEAGRRIFFNPKVGTCNTCHQVQDRGTRIGPDLTHISRTMDREQLLESLLQPNAQVAPHFELWQVRTTDGVERLGMVLRKGGTREFYIDPEGEQFSVAVDDIEVSQPLGLSPMPPGLPYNMTEQELRDLLEFLLTADER